MTKQRAMAAEAELAFDAFVAHRGRALARTAYLLTGDHHLAEDLVQTTLFKTAKAWHRIEGDPEPYVRRALYHEHISSWRRRRHLTEVPLDGPAGWHAENRTTERGDLELRLALRTALAALTPRQRTVLVLRYFEDLTETQTAAALGIAVGTVKSSSRQALHRLRSTAPHLADLVSVAGEPR